MRGTPGFVGARLREARKARGLTAIALAELLGVTRQAVSQYELKDVSPQPEVMERITSVLNLPIHFFTRPAEEWQETVYFRSMSSATKMARERAETRLDWLQEIANYIREFIHIPQTNFPNFSMPEKLSEITEDMIEERAEALRRHWGLGDKPISNVTLLAENQGILLTRGELGAETLDAVSKWSTVDGKPYVLLGSDKASAVRSRFDLAHELGHFALHKGISPEILSNRQLFKMMEDQAHAFARAFLLPAPTFADDLYVPTLEALRIIKAKWKVSIAAMLYRAKTIGLIDPEQAHGLAVNISRRHWRTKEPLDDELPVEEPRLLRRAFTLLIGENIQSRDEIKARLRMAQTDIEELANLPFGVLYDPDTQIALLPEYRRPAKRHYEFNDAESESKIIRFPR